MFAIQIGLGLREMNELSTRTKTVTQLPISTTWKPASEINHVMPTLVTWPYLVTSTWQTPRGFSCIQFLTEFMLLAGVWEA